METDNKSIYDSIQEIRDTYNINKGEESSSYIKRYEEDDIVDFFEGEEDEFNQKLSFLEESLEEGDKGRALEETRKLKSLINSKPYSSFIDHTTHESIDDALKYIQDSLK